MKAFLPGKQTLLALSLTSLLAACGTGTDGTADSADGDANNGRDGEFSSTAGGYETSRPIGSDGTNGTGSNGSGVGYNNGDNGAGQNGQGIDNGAGRNFDNNGTGARPLTFTINFGIDSTEMNQEAIGLLKEHAAYLRANPSMVVVVEGHADERGSREYNIGLGQRRAEATRRLLTLEGVTKERIDTISFGEEKPLDFSHSEGAWSTNRRAVFVYPQ